MKVVQIGKFYYPEKGGVESHLYELCMQLKDTVDLKVAVANTNNRTIKENIYGVSVKRFRSFAKIQSVSLCPTFYKIFNETADVWHFHFPNPLAVVSYLMVKPKGKVVVSWHSDIIRQKFALKFYKPILEYFLDNFVDKIFAATPNHIEYSEFLNTRREKCVVIPYGISLNNFKCPDTENIQKIKDKFKLPIVLFVGRLVYYKGIEYLIRAMENIEAALLIIGNGPLLEKLDALTKELKIEHRVFIYYKVEDVNTIYHASDVFVLPSVEPSEAFGIVQIEAMAAGKPVISTDLKSGVPWVNQHNRTGIVVEPANVEMLASAIREVLTDEELRHRYGSNARKRVEDVFSSVRMGEAILDQYNELLKNE